jgi:hypothetical protein
MGTPGPMDDHGAPVLYMLVPKHSPRLRRAAMYESSCGMSTNRGDGRTAYGANFTLPASTHKQAVSRTQAIRNNTRDLPQTKQCKATKQRTEARQGKARQGKARQGKARLSLSHSLRSSLLLLTDPLQQKDCIRLAQLRILCEKKTQSISLLNFSSCVCRRPALVS